MNTGSSSVTFGPIWGMAWSDIYKANYDSRKAIYVTF
jgi:hypothetical protein